MQGGPQVFCSPRFSIRFALPKQVFQNSDFRKLKGSHSPLGISGGAQNTSGGQSRGLGRPKWSDLVAPRGVILTPGTDRVISVGLAPPAEIGWAERACSYLKGYRLIGSAGGALGSPHAGHYCLSSVASTLPSAGIYKGALEYFDPPVLVYVFLGQNRFFKTQISANCGFHICPQGFLGGNKIPAGAKAEA